PAGRQRRWVIRDRFTGAMNDPILARLDRSAMRCMRFVQLGGVYLGGTSESHFCFYCCSSRRSQSRTPSHRCNKSPTALHFDLSCQGFNGGLTLESLRIADAGAKHTTYGTTMRVDLATPLAPGASLDIDAVWHFNVPAQGGGRMGHDGALYEIAQWYPRMAV